MALRVWVRRLFRQVREDEAPLTLSEIMAGAAGEHGHLQITDAYRARALLVAADATQRYREAGGYLLKVVKHAAAGALPRGDGLVVDQIDSVLDGLAVEVIIRTEALKAYLAERGYADDVLETTAVPARVPARLQESAG